MSQDRTGQPVVNSDKSHDRTVQSVVEGHEIQRQNSDNEQILTLLDRQREQILADNVQVVFLLVRVVVIFTHLHTTSSGSSGPRVCTHLIHA